MSTDTPRDLNHPVVAAGDFATPSADLGLAFDHAPAGMAVISLDPAWPGRLLEVNRALCELSGYTRDELLAMDLPQLTARRDFHGEQSCFEELLAGRRDSYRLEKRLLHADGTLSCIDAEVWALPCNSGIADRAMTQFHDITERRSREQRLLAETAVTRLLSHSATLGGAMPGLLSGLAQVLEADFGAAWLLDEEHETLRCHSVWQRSPDSRPRFSQVTRELRLARDACLPGRVWETGRPQCVRDVTTDRAFLRGPAAAEEGLRGAVALPVRAGAELVGAIELLSAAPLKADSDHLIELVDATAAQIAAFSAHTRAEERPGAPSKLLLVEDNPFVARLVEEMLTQTDLPLELSAVESLAEAREVLVDSRPACVLLDLTLPDADGLEAVLDVRELVPDVPVVVLTGREDEDLAAQAVRAGAQDYLMKKKVDFHGLARSIRYAMERKRAERQMFEHVLHDRLTGLPNRSLFVDRLRVAIGRAREGRPSVAVLVLDLDRFRLVNDSLGHETGDRLICEVGERLRRGAGPVVTVASLGADQFAVLLEDLGGDGQAVIVAEQLRTAVSEPMTLAGHEIRTQATVGVAFASGESNDVEALIRQAETALYRGKDLGGDRCEVYQESVRGRMRERLLIETGLRAALDRHEIEVHYQPIHALESRAIVAFEALVRWRHPDHGLLAPAQFLEVAEESGLILPLGELVLEEACRQLALWHRSFAECDGMKMNVNLSSWQLAQPGVVDTVRGALERAGITAGSLCLEITESSLIEDVALAIERLRALKELGVGVALDDFGTGYSSLSYLQRFPVDALKLDRSFVAGLDADDADTAIVAAVANMARALGLPVIAEGVETERHLDELRRMGYELGQGYHFARPLSPEAATELLSARAR